ncbi:virescein-like [Colias croceus]|uniref:virescein-like n=1 Tax=Colias crocea TaxID=72248 RepID=UPI001E27C2E2|nr:virescein-like [Colias croceus]
MKLTALFVMIVVVLTALMGSNEAAPGKIPINAIKKGAQVVGKGLRAINIASTAHDVYTFFKPKRRKH